MFVACAPRRIPAGPEGPCRPHSGSRRPTARAAAGTCFSVAMDVSRLRRAAGLALLLTLAAPLCLSAQEKKATPVVVSPVRLVEESPKSTYSGFLEPREVAQVAPTEPGFVKHIAKRAGERVSEGDVLAVLSNPSLLLDAEVLDAQVKEAEARLKQARLQLQRLKTLYESQLTPAEQYENKQAEVAVIQANLQTAIAMRHRLQERLKLLVVRSPITGQIVSDDLELSEWITTNRQIYRIADFRRMELRVAVPGRFVDSIPRGAPVEVTVPEIGQSLSGKIVAVVQHVEAESGNFIVRVALDNPRRLPLSGLLAQAVVPLGARQSLKVVPRDAIVRRGDSTQVVVVRENMAQIVPVKVEGDLENSVIVAAADLNPTEPVVVRGNERLFPGMPVDITETR